MTVADELDALRTIRAPLGELDPERAARMRARALAGVLGDPAAPHTTAAAATAVAEPDTGAEQARRSPRAGRRGPAADLGVGAQRDRRPDLVAIDDLPTVEIDLDPDRSRDHRSRRGSGGRVLVVAAAAAVVLVLVVAIGALRGGEQADVVADQPEPASLADLVANAGAAPDRPLPDGRYAHLAIERGVPFIDLDGATETHVTTRETWTDTSGGGRDHISDEVVVDATGATVEVFAEAFDDDATSGESAHAPFGYDGLRDLPTDPAALDQVLRDDVRFEQDRATRVLVLGHLLTLDVTPPGVRAAALQLLADDGAAFVGGATDRAGRAGYGIRLVRDDGFTTTFVLSRDGLLLGSYDVVTGVDPDPANAAAWTTVVVRDRVDAVG